MKVHAIFIAEIVCTVQKSAQCAFEDENHGKV